MCCSNRNRASYEEEIADKDMEIRSLESKLDTQGCKISELKEKIETLEEDKRQSEAIIETQQVDYKLLQEELRKTIRDREALEYSIKKAMQYLV